MIKKATCIEEEDTLLCAIPGYRLALSIANRSKRLAISISYSDAIRLLAEMINSMVSGDIYIDSEEKDNIVLAFVDLLNSLSKFYEFIKAKEIADSAKKLADSSKKLVSSLSDASDYYYYA